MKFARLKLLGLSGALLLIFSSYVVSAAEELRKDQFLNHFDEINTRLAALEQRQQETLEKKDKILESIKEVGIQMRRSPGVKQP